MNYLKKITFVFIAICIGFLPQQHTEAMSFDEYQKILRQNNISLSPKQEILYKKFFAKKNTKEQNQNHLATDLYHLDTILKPGTSDAESNGAVSQLQSVLEQESFMLTVDGHYGPQSLRAVEKLKKKKGVHASAYGVFDPRDFDRNYAPKRKMNLFLGSDEIFFYPLDKTHHTNIYCDGKKMTHFTHKGKTIIALSFPYGTQKSFTCTIGNGTSSLHFLTVYKKENKKITSKVNIKVSKNYTKPNPKSQKRIAEEKKMLLKIYKEASSKDKALFTSPFALPIQTKMTSPFGKTRIMNGKVSSFHSGTDFRAPTPLETYAINDGIVLYTGNLFYCGNAVIINHGLDITSAYCHLSDITTQKGAKISKGDLIGKTGSSGRASGPHLHISTKFKGKYMDFMKVYEYSQILD